MRGDADTGNPEKRVRRDLVYLEAITLLTFHFSDETPECVEGGFLPVKAECRRPDLPRYEE
jgi:hypothetical protein